MTVHALDLAPISGGGYGEHLRTGSAVVVVGYDGSPASRRAIEYAVERAGAEGRIVAVHAAGPGQWWFGSPSYQRERDDYRPAARELLEELRSQVPAGMALETDVVEGSPPSALMRVAGDCNAAEIVVGAHGSNPETRGLGNVPLALLKGCDRPLIVVPPGDPLR